MSTASRRRAALGVALGTGLSLSLAGIIGIVETAADKPTADQSTPTIKTDVPTPAVPPSESSEQEKTPEPSSATPTEYPQPVNAELMSQQQGIDFWLLNLGVYPEGGQGYEDSSLPYDDIDPFHANALTARAELLRYNYDTIQDIHVDGTQLTVICNKNCRPLDQMLAASTKVSPSVAWLRAANYPIVVDSRNTYSIQQKYGIYTIQTDLNNQAGREIIRIGDEQCDPETHQAFDQLHIDVAQDSIGIVKKALEPYASLVHLNPVKEITEPDIVFATGLG